MYEVRNPHVTLSQDLVLSKSTRQRILEAIGALRYHKIIYSDWGFSKVDPTGRNMVLNLYGPPGTGKTLAAEAIAGELRQDFIHIGISEIESKFVGETAKNISEAFSTAAREGAVLFFDEADTLLGARLSSVTQGVDNEINAMRSTLLVELERFDGVVIFATNFAKNYDSAFVSRIRYHVEFDLPDRECRRQLWARMLVAGVPLEESRTSLIERCAEASDGLSGREIRTVLRLAFPRALLEDDQNPKVRWTHIESAILSVKEANQNVGANSHNRPTGAARLQDHASAQRLLGINQSSN
jgi:AAA+ superfamily predicted ATPase